MSKSLKALEMLKNNISDYLDTIQNNEETISKTEFMFSCVYPLYELIKKDLECLGHQLEKFIEWIKEEFRKNENLVNSKDGSFSNIVELALLNDILDKLKELGLYKGEE